MCSCSAERFRDQRSERHRERHSHHAPLLLCLLVFTAHTRAKFMAIPPPPPRGNGGSEGSVGLKESGNKAFANGDLEQAHTVRGTIKMQREQPVARY